MLPLVPTTTTPSGCTSLAREMKLDSISASLARICASSEPVSYTHLIGLKRYGGDMAIGAFGILNRILILFVMLVMGLTPVSYTHLDVYKRQVLKCSTQSTMGISG